MLALALLAICFVSIKNVAGAEEKFQKYTSTSGGGRCVTENDCNGNGFCLVRDTETKGQITECMCFEDYTGKDCSVREQVTLEKVKETPNVLREEKVFTSKGERRDIETNQVDLNDEDTATVTGLDPEQLAENDQPFVIHSPITGTYMKVSGDTALLGADKGNTFIVSSKGIKGPSKYFKLKKTTGEYFNIIATDDEGRSEIGYLYVSRNKKKGIVKRSKAVMMSKSIGPVGNFEFGFKLHSRRFGLYSITYKDGDGESLFVSKDFNLKLNRFIEADSRYRKEEETIWFEFSLTEHVSYRKAGIATGGERHRDRTEGAVYDSRFYDDTDGRVNVAKFTVERELTTTKTVTVTSGIKVAAGINVKGASLSVQGTLSESMLDTVTERSRKEMSWDLDVKGKKICAVVELYYDTSDRDLADFVTILRTRKRFKVLYTVEMRSEDWEMKTKIVNSRDECPHAKNP